MENTLIDIQEQRVGDSSLIQDLWVVVQELWGADKGFEVWETEHKDTSDIMGKDFMISKMLARKWIHEDSLLTSGQVKELPVDLPEKAHTGVKLGKGGERRFSVRVGRAAHMKIIEPAEMGEIWMKIPLTSEDIHVYVDKQKQNRVSFVFTQQIAMVQSAYTALGKAASGEDN